MSLCLHAGSKAVTRDAVSEVQIPGSTESYQPVSYSDALTFVEAAASKRLGLTKVREGYGLNKKGNQLFASLTYDTGRDDSGLTFGLRQSYNKSLSLGLAVGASVFVCDNLCFSGNAFRVLKRNTRNVWDSFTALVLERIDVALEAHASMQSHIDQMKATPCYLDRGYELLGVAQGHNILTPQQASVAFGDWTEPRHEEFSDRNFWSLYNSFTEGLKYGGPATVMERHCAAHEFVVSHLN